jgi:hypothetical protein
MWLVPDVSTGQATGWLADQGAGQGLPGRDQPSPGATVNAGTPRGSHHVLG